MYKIQDYYSLDYDSTVKTGVLYFHYIYLRRAKADILYPDIIFQSCHKLVLPDESASY